MAGAPSCPPSSRLCCSHPQAAPTRIPPLPHPRCSPPPGLCSHQRGSTCNGAAGCRRRWGFSKGAPRHLGHIQMPVGYIWTVTFATESLISLQKKIRLFGKVYFHKAAPTDTNSSSIKSRIIFSPSSAEARSPLLLFAWPEGAVLAPGPSPSDGKGLSPCAGPSALMGPRPSCSKTFIF